VFEEDRDLVGVDVDVPVAVALGVGEPVDVLEVVCDPVFVGVTDPGMYFELATRASACITP